MRKFKLSYTVLVIKTFFHLAASLSLSLQDSVSESFRVIDSQSMQMNKMTNRNPISFQPFSSTPVAPFTLMNEGSPKLATSSERRAVRPASRKHRSILSNQ